MEKLDHILSQTIIVTSEEVIEMVERLKAEFIYLQNNIVSWSRSERENVWLEEVKELCNYTESIVDNFILVKERWSKMGRLKKLLYLLADYASENEFKKQLKYIRTRIGDATHRSLTYEVGGLLDMGLELKNTTPVPDFTQESYIILDILFLIATTLSDSRPLSFLCLIIFFFAVYMIVDARGKRTKRKSKFSLKKKKWKGTKTIRWFIRFLFFTVIYLPNFYLFQFHPFLSMFLFMLSYLLIEVIAWSRNLWRSLDTNLKCTQIYLAQIRAFLSDTTESAEGLNKRQTVWVDQLRVLSQYGQSLIDAYQKGKGGCLSRIKFSKDINCLLKEILDISDRKVIYCIGNIQRTRQEILPLLVPNRSIQERDIENEIIAEHDESSDATPAAAASSSSYQPVTGFKKKVQLIRGEKDLMDALLLDANAMGELDGRSRIWVEQLRVISHEAQSVINKYYAKLKHMPILNYIFKYWTRHVVSKKLDGIINKIEDTSRRRKAYGLVHIQSRVVSKVQILRARMQPSLVVKNSSVVGFDDDTQVLMAELLSDEKRRCITWIVGIGGTGKTTLAKLIFEDNTVVTHFQHHIWVSLPSNCTTNQFVAEIGKAAAKQITVEEENLSTNYLLGTLACTKYFIVVDGIEKTSKVYLDALNRAIPDMSTGSRVLFTTRNANVAQHAAGRIILHPLQLLDDETSWLLFTRHLKVDIPPKSETGLIKIGKNIVMKCGGLPLQILKMSDLLSHKDITHEEWSSVLGGQQLNEDQMQSWSEMSDTINTNLPSYLRRCLFYFVLFPAEFEIPVRRLVVLWVAESLVHQVEDNEVPPELVAERYLTELIDRNMVQVAKRKHNGKVKTCRLPSTLQQLLSKANESRFLQGHGAAMDSNADPKKSIIRRVVDHLDKDDIWNDHIHGDSTDSTSFQTYYKDVLSFHSFDTQEGSKPGQQVGNFLKGCISSDNFLLLLVLDLERVYKPNLPKCISRLTRLRYLGLRWTYLESLPSSISKLLKLQTLDLKHTYIHTLPTSIWKMELRHLFLSETYRTRFPPQPKSNFLSDLQTLWGLFVDEETPVKGGLDKLVNITKLGLACQSMSLNQEPMIAQLETVSDWITKLEYLQSLRLKSRDEKGRPWTLHLKSFENNAYLTNMYLLGSLNSSSILSQFPLSLIELTLSHSKLQDDPMILLKDFPNLRTLCLLAESYTGTTMVCESHSFPQLYVLKLWKLEQLEEWKIEPEALPCLRQVEIRSCPHLKMLPDGLEHISTLLELKLTNMPREISPETFNIPPNCQVVQTHIQ
ncbi:unnamed protein product [Lathyrus sativus]|nr:unnamed protein product [Lathyrus sativus]